MDSTMRLIELTTQKVLNRRMQHLVPQISFSHLYEFWQNSDV